MNNVRNRNTCPHCGKSLPKPRNPVPTVDVIIPRGNSIVLIKRRNPPSGWALPGGFVDYGETLEYAAVREAKEETGLDCHILDLLGVYSDPNRDVRLHTISTVFIVDWKGEIQAGDDADEAVWFPLERLPGTIAFDHARIITDYQCWKERNGR